VEHLEPILDSALAYLKTNLPLRVAALNAEADGFALEQIPEGSYYVGGKDPIPTYPSVEIAIPDWTMSRPSLDIAIVETRLPLMLRVFAQTALGEERLYRMLMRYGQCMNEAVLGWAAMHGYGLEQARGFYRFNPEEQTVDVLRGGSLYVYTLITEEVRP
jgi:hypothetical protein